MIVVTVFMFIWLLGMLTSRMFGGGIHALLVIAIAWFLLRMVSGKAGK